MIEYDLQQDLKLHLLFCLDERPDTRECKWVMHPSWEMEIRKLGDQNGRLLWEPVIYGGYCRDNGVHYMLYGYPIETDIDGGQPHLEPA